MTKNNFLHDLKIKAKDNNVIIQFPNVKEIKINGDSQVYGYFYGSEDRKTGELVVAKKLPEEQFFETLLHESCHMDQWIENCSIWKRVMINGDKNNVGERMNDWVFGKGTLKKSQVQKYLNSYIELELDCEKRTVDKIKQYRLPINYMEYIQRTNAYLLFNKAVVEKYVKYKGYKEQESPYLNVNLTKQMPTRFLCNYLKVSKKLQKVFDKFYKP